MSVSLIIACHNQHQFLRELIHNLNDFKCCLAQVQIIIIDSSDFLMQIPCDIELYRVPNNGPSAARNYGAAKAKGDWLVFCDADDLVSPLMLQYLTNLGDINDADALFFPYQRAYDEVIFNEASVYYKEQTLPGKIYSVQIKSPIYFLKNFFPVHAVAIKRDLFKGVNFNESQWFIEDVRFYTELAMLSNIKLFYIDEAAFTSFHRDFRSKVSLSSSNDAEYWEMVCANYDFVAINHLLSFCEKITLAKLLTINYHIVDSTNKLYIKQNCNKIWNYFLGIPMLFQNQILYNCLIFFSRLNKMLKY